MSEQLKVLVISSTYPPMNSGGGDYAFRLCRKLAERGVRVDVLTSEIEGYPECSGVTVYPLVKRWTWSALPKILQLIFRLRPNVINLHYGAIIYDDHPMIILLPAILFLFGFKCRFVTLLESVVPARVYLCSLPVRAFHKVLIRLVDSLDYGFGALLSHSNCIVVLSEALPKILDQHCPGVYKKCHVIPPPPLMKIQTDNRASRRKSGRDKLGVSQEAIVIAYNGYLYPGKGLETLFDAFSLLRAAYSHAEVLAKDLYLVIIGGVPEIMLQFYNRPNYLNDLKNQVDELGIADYVIWTGGYDTDSSLPSLYLNAADIAILPFDTGVRLNNSSFGAVAAHGLPIVTTSHDQLESTFLDEKNVLLVSPSNSEALFRAAERLLNDPPLREKLSCGALALAREWFDWDRATDKIVALFKGLN